MIVFVANTLHSLIAVMYEISVMQEQMQLKNKRNAYNKRDACFGKVNLNISNVLNFIMQRFFCKSKYALRYVNYGVQSIH